MVCHGGTAWVVVIHLLSLQRVSTTRVVALVLAPVILGGAAWRLYTEWAAILCWLPSFLVMPPDHTWSDGGVSGLAG